MIDHKNPLSQRYPHDAWECVSGGPIRTDELSDMALAANGLKAVLRIVRASDVEVDCEPSQPLEPGHVSGLMDAAQALAAMLEGGLFAVGERLARTAEDEAARRGVRHVWQMNLVPVREEKRHD